ncbi:hypothetical protein [Halothiobacillus sp.]|uniref:hypothetical protein n=1 Tax=Halothiobacillus sp. TaxID=1891311 RepID=UPI00261BD3E9|nr:hypothetical protein [Halothiobacillus sp.]
MNSYSKANQTFKPFPGLGKLGEMAGEYTAEKLGLSENGKGVCRSIGHYTFEVAGIALAALVTRKLGCFSTGSQGL